MPLFKRTRHDRSILSLVRDTRGIRRFLSVALFAWWGTPVHAQIAPLPDWMMAALGLQEDSTQAPAQSTIGYQLRSHTNRFIGTWTLEGTSERYPGLNGTLTCWSDTAQVILRADFANLGHHVYMADMRANVAILAVSNKNERNASVYKWGTFLAMDRYDDHVLRNPANFRSSNAERTILGQRCVDHPLREDLDTIHYWLSALEPSPFKDMRGWMPGQGAFNAAHELSLPLEGTVLLKADRYFRYEVTALVYGPQPRPVIDLLDHTLSDRRNDIFGSAPTLAPRRPPEPYVPEPIFHSSVDEWPVEIRVIQRPTGMDALIDERSCSVVTVELNVARDGTVRNMRLTKDSYESASPTQRARALAFAKEFRYEPGNDGPKWREPRLTFIFRSTTDPDCGLFERMIKQKRR